MLGCVSEAVPGECQRGLRMLEAVRGIWEYVGERCFRKREINRFPNRVTGSTRKIYFCVGQDHLGFQHADIVENIDTWLFGLIRFLKLPILVSIFVSGTGFLQVSFDPIFLKNFSTPCACRERKNFVFWFGAQFNSTLNFTQSGWRILFIPDLHFRSTKLGKLPNTLSLAVERRPVQTSHCVNVLPPYQGEKRVVFLAILAVARMVIWTMRNKGLYDDANFSHRDLILYFRHQLRVKIRCDRKRLDRITFSKRWVNAASLVVRKGATLESSFPPLPAHGVYGTGP